MSDIMQGYDRYTISTPVEVRRGSSCVLRRTCQKIDRDTYQESTIDISGATAIRFEVVSDNASATGSVLSKSLGSGIALVSGGTTGIIDITLTAADTKNLRPGVYKGVLAVTLSSGFYKFKPYHFTILAVPKSNES